MATQRIKRVPTSGGSGAVSYDTWGGSWLTSWLLSWFRTTAVVSLSPVEHSLPRVSFTLPLHLEIPLYPEVLDLEDDINRLELEGVLSEYSTKRVNPAGLATNIRVRVDSAEVE